MLFNSIALDMFGQASVNSGKIWPQDKHRFLEYLPAREVLSKLLKAKYSLLGSLLFFFLFFSC